MCVTDPEAAERLARLEARIEALKNKDADTPHQEEHYSQAQHAWRMVIELVAGIAIGFGMGYGLDSLFGTIPIFLVLFTLLGFAAGVKTMIATAAELQKTKEAGPAEPDKGDPPGRDKRTKHGE